jgi:hypothetical protein
VTVAFLTNDWAEDRLDNLYIPNGTPFYRCFLPMTVTPHSVMGKPRFSPREGFGVEDGRYGKFGYDTVLLKMLMDKQIVKQIELARAIGQRVVVDVDDFAPGLHHTNVAHHYSDPKVSPGSNWQTHEQVILAASTVTVSTPFLRDYYDALHPDVRMIRNGIDLGMFAPLRDQQHVPVVGWMGSLGWRSEDLETMAPWLPGFIAQHRLRFHHGGHVERFGYAYEKIGIPRGSCSVQPMVPMTRLRSLMEFDIGLVPLNDIPFNHAKSALKGLEYAASGIPFVAQGLPEYQRIAADGIGQTAQTPAEWTERVGWLLSRKNRAEAVEEALAALPAHSIEARASEWQAVLS